MLRFYIKMYTDFLGLVVRPNIKFLFAFFLGVCNTETPRNFYKTLPILINRMGERNRKNIFGLR